MENKLSREDYVVKKLSEKVALLEAVLAKTEFAFLAVSEENKNLKEENDLLKKESEETKNEKTK